MAIPDEVQNPRPRRRLTAIAQIAEIVTSVAVLITLVFLVLGVRQNTDITRSSAYERSMAGLNEWRLALASDPELARLFATYQKREPGNLRSTDFRLQLILNTIWGVYENSYYAHQRRILGDSEWSRFETQICVGYDRDALRWTPAPGLPSNISIRPLLTEEFAEYTESLCEA